MHVKQCSHKWWFNVTRIKVILYLKLVMVSLLCRIIVTFISISLNFLVNITNKNIIEQKKKKK